jgi:hypothetical protein
MKLRACWIALLTLAAIGHSQAKKSPALPDLDKFSSDQLKACFDDKSICGTDNVYAISDELAKRLPAFSIDQLVACFADWKICGAADSMASGWQISDELARRGNPHALLIRYWTEPSQDIKRGIVDIAYHFHTPEVTAFMKKVLAAGQGDEDALYWPANYLAKRCDTDGLKWLSMRHGRPEGCIIWAPTVALFGKCHYRPSIPYLVDYSIHDACLNIDDAAVEDLQVMYPNSPKAFDSLEEMQTYFCSRAKQEGFKVDCESK